jgi:hypothetical protein
VSYNTDNQLNSRPGDLLSFCREVKADVVLLQDTAGLRWSSEGLLGQGWTLRRHGRCAILLRVDTAETLITTVRTGEPKPPKVWKSARYDSMAIALLTAQGPMLVSTSYLPPDVDRITGPPTDPDRMRISDQHREIADLARRHVLAVAGMDANETMSYKGRMQLKRN